MDDQSIKLSFQYVGAEKAEELRRTHAALKGEIADLAAALGRGEIESAEFDAEMRRVAVSSRNLEQAIRALDAAADEETQALIRQTDALVRDMQAQQQATAATAGASAAKKKLATDTERVGAASKGAAKGAGDMGRGFLELSRAVEDAQYGIGGLLNNIPQAITMFGGPSGLAAVVSLTAVGAYSLRGEFAKLNDSLNDRPWVSLGNSIGAVKQRLEELTSRPHKLDIDYSRIDEAKKLLDVMEKKLAAFKAIGDQSDTQEKVGKAVTNVIKEESGGTDEQSGKENLEKLITRAGGTALEDEAINSSGSKQAELIKEAQERLKKLREMKPQDLDEAQAIGNQINSTLESIAKLRHDLKDIVKEKVDSIIGGAARGIEADRARIADLFDKNQRLFTRGDEAAGIKPVSPIFGQALDEAGAPNIKRIEAEEQADRNEEEKRKNDAFIRGVRKERGKETAKTFKEALDDELDILKGMGAVDDAARALTAKAKEQKLAGEEAFAFVKRELDAMIRGTLDERGFAIPAGQEANANQPIGDLATQAARAARVKAGGAEKRGDAKEGKDEVKALNAEAKVKEDALDAEVAKINRELGKQRQAEYEIAGARNAQLAANGAPIARNASQERQYQNKGIPYAVPQDVLERRQRAQLAQEFRRRGADPQAANLAAHGIVEKGNEDYSRRAADAANSNLGVARATLELTNQLVSEYQRMSGIQRQLMAEAKQQGKKVRSVRQGNGATIK
jgi:hypothetical protein